MFDLGAQELVVIFVVALLVFGPKRLPELARTMGKGIGQLKKAVFDIKSQVDAEISGVEGDIKEHIPAWKDVSSKFPDLAAERDALRDTVAEAEASTKAEEAEPRGSKEEEDASRAAGEGEKEDEERMTPPVSQAGDEADSSSDADIDEHHAVETDEPLEEDKPIRRSNA